MKGDNDAVTRWLGEPLAVDPALRDDPRLSDAIEHAGTPNG